LSPAHRGHRAEALGGNQHLVAHARIHGVERHHRVAAVGAVQVQRLYEEDLRPRVTRVFVGRHQLADDARNQHGLNFRRRDVPAR